MSRHDHATAAAAFQADPERAGWHDQALWHVRMKRDAAAAAVEDWEALREHAATVRRHTIAHADTYAAQFVENAQQRGIQVHLAPTAAHLRDTVARLLGERGITRVVKSKSMLTEECGLNPHLEHLGIDVVDTDLGERIVQLRAEPPSHIVMPAIHLKAADVGTTFAQHLGTSPTEADPTRLTQAARHHLRERFRAAQAGITGVNFALADTGTFVVCTNEGNADLGAHLPSLHIACMGIDKLLPRRADLPVFLRLLARSGTGQPLTAYTSELGAPRPGGELHVILVDNGRSALRESELLRTALSCIRCGACLNTCPVYRRSGGHSYGPRALPGPIGAVLAAGRDPKQHGSLPDACTLCGSCAEVCPVKVPLPDQLLALRAAAAPHRRPGLRRLMRLLGWILAKPDRAQRWGRIAATLARFVPERLQGRRLPQPSATSFRDYARAHKAAGSP